MVQKHSSLHLRAISIFYGQQWLDHNASFSLWLDRCQDNAGRRQLHHETCA